MKHLKTFENYSVNEEIFGLSSKERAESKKKELQTNQIDKYVPIWVKKQAIEQPSQETLNKFWADAAKDGYEGVAGIIDKKLVYKPSKNVTWGNSPSGASGNQS